jgi:DNA/RNA-binding domain of Phe-tRNA-synthetase-like protein
MSLTIALDPHPLLDAGVFGCRLVTDLASTETPVEISHLARQGATAPLTADDKVRTAVRDLLRHGGFKPAGRSKPASEYLVGALAEQRFPTINSLVDACNVVSLHSGLPISLVDLDRIDRAAELTIKIAPAGTSYPFNPTGQVIDVSGLICLYDAQGPTGTPVKDAQRTKTHDQTRHAIAIVWGTRALGDRTARTTRWYRELCALIPGATVEDVTLRGG